MNTIIAHRYMSNFETQQAMIEWCSKYHVYTPYMKHIDMCWTATQNHKGKSDEHKLDYFLQVYKNSAGKFCLSIKRSVRPKPDANVLIENIGGGTFRIVEADEEVTER